MTPCLKCNGSRTLPYPVVVCMDVPCFEHFTHFDYKKCWVCRGCGRADVFTHVGVKVWKLLTSVWTAARHPS